MTRTTKTNAKSARPAPRKKPAATTPSARPGTKAAAMIGLLNAKKGATISEMMEATGWQAHSVRGFLAGSLRKRHGLAAASERSEGEPRRYRLA
jgi:hypothetical protein